MSRVNCELDTGYLYHLARIEWRPWTIFRGSLHTLYETEVSVPSFTAYIVSVHTSVWWSLSLERNYQIPKRTIWNNVKYNWLKSFLCLPACVHLYMPSLYCLSPLKLLKWMWKLDSNLQPPSRWPNFLPTSPRLHGTRNCEFYTTGKRNS